MSQALTDSYTHYNGLMRSEKRSEMIDEYNYDFLQRIKKVEEEIKLVESEIILAALKEDWYHEAELMKSVVKKENKIERLKTQLING